MHTSNTPTIAISPSDLLEIARLAGGLPAVFSCNHRGEVWPFATFGLTPDPMRRHVRGSAPLLDAIAEYVLRVRENGGRFWIDEHGVGLVSGRHRILTFVLPATPDSPGYL